MENGIYLSPRRPIGKNSGYADELRNAQILRDFGSTVYLAPERNREKGKKHDAIVDGQVFEFKNTSGNANTLVTHFLRSRSQAPNVFINLEASELTQREVISTLRRAMSRDTHTDYNGNVIKGYTDSNQFAEGMIVLKLRGQNNLIYLDVNELEKTGG